MIHLDWRSRYRFLVILLVTDAVFVLLHLLWLKTDLVDSRVYSITTDRGHAEFFQYTKELWVALLLFFHFLVTRAWIYLGWALVFFYILLDDSLRLHENAGEIIASALGYRPLLGLRAVDYGELTVFLMLGMLLAIPLWVGHITAAPALRNGSRNLFLLLLLFAFFGGILDVADSLSESLAPALKSFFEVLEDGGEMVVMSGILWYVKQLVDA